LEDAEEEERAKLEMPDEILERTEAHDLRLADFVDGVVEDAREGDLSRRRYVSEGELALIASGVDPSDSDCLTVTGLSVAELSVRNTAWCSMGGGWSTDMRVRVISAGSPGKKACDRAGSSRRRNFLFLVRRSALTDLRKRTRMSIVARSLGLQSSILRSGRRFFRCLCELRCLCPSRVN
jgi:hypothetical protein